MEYRQIKTIGYVSTSATVEDANAAITAIMDLVMTKHRVAFCLDPNSSHRIVKDLIVLNNTKATVVHQDTSVLSSPNLIASYQRVASSSVKITFSHAHNTEKVNSHTM